ncbi:MAG: FAD-dependent oxidoreductase, partial [Desulfovibrio sp.]|nr:FAD-dependent oxidoreductase [Desulfovibrio sp.]
MSQHVLIIGAVALGPKAACRFKRLEPDSVVTMIDKDTRISYGGCGIPYFVSGDVSAASDLTTTSFHMVRDTAFFRDVKGVEVRTGLEALAIDRAARTVRVRDLASGREEDISYDKLVLATGSAPRVLPVPGHDLPGVHVVANLEAAESIRASVTAGGVEKAVVIGAGFVGLEMAEALSDMWDVETTVIETAPRIMVNNLGPALSAMALKHITDKGLTVRLSETVTAIEGQGRVQRVVTDKRTIEADLVIMAAGVIPNSDLAARAGLAVSGRGGIVVDASMRTSDPDIFAGGDCVEVPHLVTGKPFSLPMGSMANRQGRVIGDNLAGGASVFRGAAGSFAIKLFERAVSGTGLTLEQAKREGLDAISALVVQLDRAHFYPGKELMTLELVVERGSRRVVGIQGMGASGDALVGRIGAVAAMMPFSPTVENVRTLEYPYAPPYAAAMDVINTVGNV